MRCDVLFICSSSDQGVIRNGGRLGARWAPQALLSQFKKLASHSKTQKLAVTEVSSQSEEVNDFIQAQAQEEVRLSQVISSSKNIIHIGGGHDHVLPLLRALGTNHPLVVLNIDAHCDTRLEKEPHSGNPFRIFDQATQYSFKLFQYGIHKFANSETTLTPLKKGQMHLLYREECDDKSKREKFLFSLKESLTNEALLIFSLDCDALKASDVSAVSAPNHNGVPLEQVLDLIREYKEICKHKSQPEIYGIYEFNPLYDSLSGCSARTIVGLIDKMTEENG